MPELIGFLNGTLIRNVFGIKTAIVKFLSCVCAVGSGLPVGPEGPMIHLGYERVTTMRNFINYSLK